MNATARWLFVTLAPLAAGFVAASFRPTSALEPNPGAGARSETLQPAPVSAIIDEPVSLDELSEIPDPFTRARHLWSILASSTPAELQAMFEQTGDWSPSASLTKEVRDELMRRWLELDADHALAYVNSLGSARLDAELDRFLFTIWGRVNPGAALAAAYSLDPARRRQALLTTALAMADFEPERVIRLALADPALRAKGVRAARIPGHSRSFQDPIEVALSTLSKNDPRRARFWFSQLPVSDQLASASTVGFYLAKENPDEALEWAASLEDAGVKTAAHNATLRSLYLEGWDGALDRIAALAEPDRDALIKRIFDDRLSMDGDQIDGLLPLLSDAAKSGADGLRLAQMLGGKRGAEMGLALGKKNQSDAIRIISEWAALDPGAALAWGDALDPESPLTSYIQFRILKGTIKGHQQAIGILESPSHTLSPSQRINLISSTAAGFASEDPAGAFAWAHSLEGKEKQTALEFAIYSHWQNDREAATARVEQEPPGELRNAMAGRVIQVWSGYTGEEPAATEWLWGLPDPPLDVVKSFFDRWISLDITAASKALGELPRGVPRDTAIRVLVHEIARENMEMALLWAGEIQSAHERQKVMDYLYRLNIPPEFVGPW